MPLFSFRLLSDCLDCDSMVHHDVWPHRFGYNIALPSTYIIIIIILKYSHVCVSLIIYSILLRVFYIWTGDPSSCRHSSLGSWQKPFRYINTCCHILAVSHAIACRGALIFFGIFISCNQNCTCANRQCTESDASKTKTHSPLLGPFTCYVSLLTNLLLPYSVHSHLFWKPILVPFPLEKEPRGYQRIP